ncbi:MULTISPECIES: hypothetical protein [Pseudomonas]|uniref:hypothetical protein n=1 Tax=Pseudomonas sp. MIL9 TaxID=2807620 RepID=UPI0010294F62|nr:hypothetical protein [Pseudomonas sp. MIL9]MBM6448028.1 hypothetical protein [Pseudomonas sp. MIL9]RZN98104.1 hypothetical protein EKG40_31465 [Pseudomonas moorei]
MKAGIAVAVALVAAMTSGPATAVGMAYGYGALGCGKFVAATDEKRAGYPQSLNLFMAWLSGFVSYSSLMSEIEYFKGTDSISVQLWLENYCRANPLEPFNTAALALLLERTPK